MNSLFEIVTTQYAHQLIFKTYERQELIFSERSLCKTMGLIIKGKMHIQTFSCGEVPYTIQTLTSGDIFGETLIFSINSMYLGLGVALEKTKIAYISKSNLITMMHDDSLFLQAYLQEMAEKSINHQVRLKVLLQKTIRDKVLFYLQEQAKTQASLMVKIPTKEAWAAYLNIPRPSLSRELIFMEKDGLIKNNRYSILLNSNTCFI
ncbi:MAG: Crp/Fnr family transcriptional regulator [Bacilli bacterium]